MLSIHEITHYLAFKSFLANKVLACIANLPIVVPFCVEFKVGRARCWGAKRLVMLTTRRQRFHMDHHRFQGVDGIDGDLPSDIEAKLLNNPVGKFLFCAVQILFYGGPRRPPVALSNL